MKQTKTIISPAFTTNVYHGIDLNVYRYILVLKFVITAKNDRPLQKYVSANIRSFMSCNVAQYLPPDDSPVEQVERIVHLRMNALQGKKRGRGKHFLPPRDIEFAIITSEGHTFHLTCYCLPDLGEYYLALEHGREILRKFHAHEGHCNPNNQNSPTTYLHMHFPTTKYPLVKNKSSYAYSIDDGYNFDDVSDCLRLFCIELGINLSAWQPYLHEYE